jgi:hypothetical protein
MSKLNKVHHLGFLRGNPFTSAHAAFAEHVKDAADTGEAGHSIILSRSQDAKKNPLTPEQKLKHAQRAAPEVNFKVASKDAPTLLHHASNLHSQGVRHLVVHASSDRVDEFHKLLNAYNGKEGRHGKYKFDKIEVKQFGEKRVDSGKKGKGMKGVSGTNMRQFAQGGTKKDKQSFFKMAPPKMSDEHKEDLWNDTRKGLQMESTSPIGIFLIGGPGSGKDYVLKNIFSRFDLTEVQVEHILNGSAAELIESKANIIINGALDEEKIIIVKQILEGYTLDNVYVSVTNRVSKLRNSLRENPLNENKRLEKWYRSEQLKEKLDCFVFNNSINLNESGEIEKLLFTGQIEKLLERLINYGLQLNETTELKSFTVIKEKKFPTVRKDKESGLPQKYVSGLSTSTAKARAAHWKKMSKYSDKDPRAYKPAPGDATSETKPSKHTLAVRKMMAKEEVVVEKADTSLAAKAEKSGISVSTLRKVYNRGVAAWNSGHRPGTTPQQWGHARVNSYINKGKTYHTADKDLREENDLDVIFERQLVGTDEYRRHAIAMTPGQKQEIDDAFENLGTTKGSAMGSVKEGACGCGGNCECGGGCQGECGCNGTISENRDGIPRAARKFSDLRKISEEKKEEEKIVDTTPTLKKGEVTGKVKAQAYTSKATSDGLPVVSRLTSEEKLKGFKFMPVPRQVPAQVPAGTKVIDGVPQHNVPKGFKRVRDHIAGFKLVKEEVTLEEAIQYHLENKISFTENVFRPGSDMFFEMIKEAKRLYAEGKYEPKNEWEKDMLESNIGEIVEFEGQTVVLDYPVEEGLEEACWSGYTQKGMKKKGDKMVPNCVPVNEEDKTDGKGIGKPWREGGGGAVYVRDGESIRKIRFSQSGMKKKYMDPGATRSFVARHRCLTNKDKTSASYWACRWPRFFSNSGKVWW